MPVFHSTSCERLNMLVVHGHGRGTRLGTCLVLELCALCMVILQHVAMLEYAGCAWTWIRYAHRYVPSVSHMCCRHSCVYYK